MKTYFALFQFTPLREGRPRKPSQNEICLHFNSRPSARGDAADVHAGRGKVTDFNSRPSARGDAWMGEEALEDLISIHAPPRGATR